MHEKIVDYCARTISREDFRELERWLAADPANREEFLSYLKIYKESRGIALVGALDDCEAWGDIRSRIRRRRLRSLRVRTASAAAAAVILAAGAALLMRGGGRTEPIEAGGSRAVLELADGRTVTLGGTAGGAIVGADGTLAATAEEGLVYENTPAPAQEEIHSIYIPVGGEYGITLADGTRVRLNSDTRLRYPAHFAGATREVWVEGEIYLDVVPDAARPFVVNTPDTRIEVLGTSFNVSAYPSDAATVTTLLSGRVAVEAAGVRTEIAPDQQATVRQGLTTVKDVDAAAHASWTSGTFEFENMPLGEICARLSRWYDVEFEFAEPSCADRRFTGGTWKYVPLDDFLGTMEKAARISFRIGGRKIIVRNAE